MLTKHNCSLGASGDFKDLVLSLFILEKTAQL